MDLPPRFPQPAIEALLEYAGWRDVQNVLSVDRCAAQLKYADWRDVLNLLSVDQREAPARRWLINATGMIRLIGQPKGEVDAFIAKYPSCVRWTQNVHMWDHADVNRIVTSVGWIASLRTQNLTHLTLYTVGGDWDVPIDKLPATLVHLELPYGNRSPLSVQNLPPRLQWFKLGTQRVTDLNEVTWPTTLTHLTLGGCFNQSVRDLVFPTTLTSLTFGPLFEHSVAGTKWPPRLERLRLGESYDSPLVRFADLPAGAVPAGWPAALTPNEWPTTLRHLDMGEAFDWPLERYQLPPNLEHLVLGREYKFSVVDLGEMPPTLRRLELHSEDMLRFPNHIMWVPNTKIRVSVCGQELHAPS
jgi:hypothetical protein